MADKISSVKTSSDKIKKGKYESQWGEKTPAQKDSISLMAEELLDKIIASGNDYSYDMNADPLYRYYRDMYKQNASLTAENVFGLASGLTGGYGNSYAATVAGKAAGDVLSGLAEVASQLESKAYDRYKDGISRNQQRLDALKTAGSVKQQEQSASFDRAEFFAKYGDTSPLEALGVDVSVLEEDKLRDIAEVFAKYGDYSLLRSLGVDTSSVEAKDYYNRLLLQAKYRKA